MPYYRNQDHTQLFFKDWGNGKPIVFISSWAISSRMWENQMEQLTNEGFRCIAYDRRGHGRSDDPGKGYDYDSLAEDLHALIVHLNLREVMLVGHSMGSGEIVRYLTRYGSNRIDRIALLAGSVPFPLKTEDNPVGFERSFIDSMRDAWKKDFPNWLSEAETSYFGEGLPGCNVSAKVGEWTRWDMLHTSFQAVLNCYETVIETDFRDEMGKIDVPALIIHGDSDQSMPIEISGEKSAQLIPDNKFIVYENAPHGLYMTHAERVTSDLKSFFKQKEIETC